MTQPTPGRARMCDGGGMRTTRLCAALATLATLGAACGPSAASGDCADMLLPGDLVVTEVFADAKAPPGGSGTDEGKEWFEIYNASDRALDLEGLTVTHSRPDGSKAKSHVMKAATIAPGQYLTLGNSVADLLPAYVDYGYSADLGDFFNTDGGKLALACGSSEIDAAGYEAVNEGASRQFTSAQAPDYTGNDDLASWCEAKDTEFEIGNFGTPGDDNDCVPIVIGQCTEGGVARAQITPMVGDLVITEVMPNPGAVSDTEGEWFEVTAINPVDLNGLGLDRAGDTSNPVVIDSATCLPIAAGEHVLFVKNDMMAANGGLPTAPIRGSFGFSMVDGSAAAPGDVRIMSGATVIDAITWTSTRSGRSHQLDPDRTDPSANDDASNFCDGATTYGGGDLGTPGELNAQCAAQPGPGECLDNGTPRAIVKPAVSQIVITEFLADPTGTTDAQKEWIEVTNAGSVGFDLNGLGLKGSGSSPTVNLITSADCKSVPAGGFALFAHTTDPTQNGMLPEVDATFSFALVQSNGRLEILDGTTVLDLATWTSSTQGAAKQLDPVADPAPYCDATAPYGDGTNKGTPKAANATCP